MSVSDRRLQSESWPKITSALEGDKDKERKAREVSDLARGTAGHGADVTVFEQVRADL